MFVALFFEDWLLGSCIEAFLFVRLSVGYEGAIRLMPSELGCFPAVEEVLVQFMGLLSEEMR